MDYRTIISNQVSIKKLTDTNEVPWAVALQVADFADDVDYIIRKYNKAFNAIQFKYGRLLLEGDGESNTPAELEKREEEHDQLFDSAINIELRVPHIDTEVIKKLYDKKKTEESAKGETYFNIIDIKAFRQLGILIIED